MIDFSLLLESVPTLLIGLQNTLVISIFGCLIGIIGGTVLGVAQYTGGTFTKYLIGTFVGLLRGTPMLLQILMMRYIPPQLGIELSPLIAAIAAIGLNSCAYISQIVRSGVAAISRGQWEAGQVLGLSTGQTLRYVVLPQAFANIIPILGNEFVTLVKDSSLAAIIGVPELTKQARQITSTTYDFLTPMLAAAVIYLVLTSTLTALFNYLERRTQHHA